MMLVKDIENSLKDIISHSLQCEKENIKISDGWLTHEKWDSLAQISIITGVENAFNISIPDNLIIELNNVDMIIKYIKEIKESE